MASKNRPWLIIRACRADAREPLRIHQLDAKGQVIDAGPDQAVVPAEVALRRQLHADEHPDLFLDGLNVWLRESQAA
jgi:hypothetical protein